MDDPELPKRHVFSDSDAAVIYQGLMTIVDAIADLKEVIVMGMTEVIPDEDA
jgi:hypothetical protein